MNFQIELSSICNLRCTECATVQMERPGAFMERRVFDTILSRYVLPYKLYDSTAYFNNRNTCPPTVILHKDGESTLHKEYDDFLAAVSRADPSLKIDIYTHGLTLPKKPGFIEFLGSLPSRMRMLLTFHFFNGDGSRNDYVATDALLRKYLDEGRWPANVELILASHVVRPMTADLLAAWKSSWQKYIDRGLTVHANCNINPWAGRIDEPGTVQFNGCPYGDFGHMFFGVTGNIISCCLDLEEEIIHGNVMVDDPAEMVAKVDAFYAEQRRVKEAGERVTHGVCANCYGQKREAAGGGELVQVGTL